MSEIDYGYPGQPFTYVFRQEVTEGGKRDGTIWTSPLMRTRAGDSYSKKREIVQGVIGGQLSGGARWAETPDGTLIYGHDRSAMFGKEKELTVARRYEILKEADALRAGPRRRGPGKAKAAPKYRVVVAWLNRNYDPPKPAAAAWKSSVAESSLLEVVTSARHHAAREHTVHESALVLTFPMSEKDPLGKARAKVLDAARGLGPAERLGYEKVRAGEKHEGGKNPHVSRPPLTEREVEVLHDLRLPRLKRKVTNRGSLVIERVEEDLAGRGFITIHRLQPGVASLGDYYVLTAAGRKILGEYHAWVRGIGTPSASRHEGGSNPRVSRSARDMTLKARVNALVGRSKK